MSQVPFITSNTNTATFLVLQGFNLLGIQYEPRPNGGKRGFFIFSPDDKIKEFVALFESDQAQVNFTQFENTKSGLLDRIVRELP